MTELKPCPFCGHNAHVMQLKQSVSARYYVVCGNNAGQCIASEHYVFGRFFTAKQDAVNAWNRRTDDGQNPA